jgi:hypothetical protein
VYTISIEQYDKWWIGIVWQTTERQGIESRALIDATYSSFYIDPLFLTLGLAGLVFAELKRDFLLLLWIIPFGIFQFFIGWTSYWHITILLPALSIAATVLIVNLSSRTKVGIKSIIILGIVFFGFIATTILITTSVTDQIISLYAFLLEYTSYSNNESITTNSNVNDAKTTLIGPPSLEGFYWLMKHVFDRNIDFKEYDDIKQALKAEKVILIPNEDFMKQISRDDERANQLKSIYNSTKMVALFKIDDGYILHKYPYNSIEIDMLENRYDIGSIEVRANY